VIGQVREWLPRDVMIHDVVRETVELAVASWSARWFADPYASVTTMKPMPGDPRNEKDEAGWRIYRSAIAIRGTRPALSRMTDRALDIDASMPDLTEADRYVLTGLERAILENLAEGLELAFGLTGDGQPSPQKILDPLAEDGGVVVSLADPAGRDILAVAIPADVLLPRIKAHLGPPSRRMESLPSLTEPLGSVNVAIEARVGRVELTLAELNGLGVGDVLILDRTLDQAVDIASAETRQIFAKAMLTSIDNDMALVFGA